MMKGKGWHQKLEENLNQALILKAVEKKPLQFKDLINELENKMSMRTLATHLNRLVRKEVLKKEYDESRDAVVYQIRGRSERDRLIKSLKRQIRDLQEATPSVKAMIDAKWKRIEEEAKKK